MGPERIIQLQEDATPYYVNRACLIPFADRSEMTQLLDDYVERVLIAPAEEATDRAAPLVVLRRSKRKPRIVVVYTRLYISRSNASGCGCRNRQWSKSVTVV
jgi:hypothetical protein